MDKLQKERDEFLLYILQNPPPNVTILLPPGAKSVTDLNISFAVNPLPLYAKANTTSVVEVDLQSVPLLTGSITANLSSSFQSAPKTKLGVARGIAGYFMNLMNSYRLARETEDQSSTNPHQWKSSHFVRREGFGSSNESTLRVDNNKLSTSNGHCAPLPLGGSDSRTLAEYVAPFAEKKETPQWDPVNFPLLPTVEFFPLIDGSMLSTLLDEEDRVLVVYEHMLMGSGIIATLSSLKSRDFLESYRNIAGISEEQHKHSIASLVLRDSSVGALGLNVPTLERLVQSSADGAFVIRMQKVLRICRDYPDNPNERLGYPLALRTFLYSGAFQVLPKCEKDTTQRKGYVQEVIDALRAALNIPSTLEPFCLFHANIFAQSETNIMTGTQREFLKGVAKAVNALPTQHLSNEPLSAETKYKLFVLQETFETCAGPMPLISGNLHDQVLLCLSALFVEACLSLPPEFLSVSVRVDGQAILPPTSSANDFLLMLLMIFIEQSILSEFGTINLLDVGTPEHLLKPLRSIGKRPRAYCELLSLSLKNVNALVLPGVAMAGSHVLACHWRNALKKGEVPVDFADGIKALLALLVQFSTKTVTGDEEVCRVLAASGNKTFKWIADISTIYDTVTNEHNEAEYCKATARLMTPESAKTADGSRLPNDAYLTVDLIVNHMALPRPPPLVPSPDELVRSRLFQTSHYLEGIASILQGHMKLPVAHADLQLQLTAAPAQRSYLHDYRTLLDRAERISALGTPPLEDLILRLQCLARIQVGWHRIVRYCANEYATVRLVTGAPPFPFDDLLLVTGESTAQAAAATVCEFTAVAIVHSELGGLLDMFMRINLSLYRRLKRDKLAVAERRHLMREFPDVTMEMILNKLNTVFSKYLGCLETERLREELHERTGQHLVAALYNIYLDGPVRFFVPEDWEGIVQDLDRVEAFLLRSAKQLAKGREKVEEVRRHSVVLLGCLRQIVRYCFSQTSTVLVEGSDGVPPLAHLPDISKTSPWCKYVVRRVLEHRKDKTAKANTASKLFRMIADDA